MADHKRAVREGKLPVLAGAAALGDPVEFIHADHLRNAEIRACLDRIAAEGGAAADTAIDLIGFLREALELHIADETEDLFPMLRRRCAPEDDIPRAIARLETEHRQIRSGIPEIIAILRNCAERPDVALSPMDCATLRDYAALARKHLVFENAIVMPFARLRLTQHDRESLRLRMLQRRGLDRLMEI